MFDKIRQKIPSLEMLFEMAEEMNVEIACVDLDTRSPGWEGYTQGHVIYLDKHLNQQEQRCVLALELGHVLYPPRPGHMLYHHPELYLAKNFRERGELQWRVQKDEELSRKWATGFLIPDEHFWEFAAGGPKRFEDWLEKFDVTKWFMEYKVGFMRQQKYFKWREIVIRTG